MSTAPTARAASGLRSASSAALLAEKYATTWWARRKAVIEADPPKPNIASKARGAVFRGQRRAAELADRNHPLAARAVGAVLKGRDRARVRTRRSNDDG